MTLLLRCVQWWKGRSAGTPVALAVAVAASVCALLAVVVWSGCGGTPEGWCLANFVCGLFAVGAVAVASHRILQGSPVAVLCVGLSPLGLLLAAAPRPDFAVASVACGAAALAAAGPLRTQVASRRSPSRQATRVVLSGVALAVWLVVGWVAKVGVDAYARIFQAVDGRLTVNSHIPGQTDGAVRATFERAVSAIGVDRFVSPRRLEVVHDLSVAWWSVMWLAVLAWIVVRVNVRSGRAAPANAVGFVDVVLVAAAGLLVATKWPWAVYLVGLGGTGAMTWLWHLLRRRTPVASEAGGERGMVTMPAPATGPGQGGGR